MWHFSVLGVCFRNNAHKPRKALIQELIAVFERCGISLNAGVGSLTTKGSGRSSDDSPGVVL